jgi:peptide/nickel transport system ATP-binding protein
MHGGRLIELGPTRDVLHHPREAYTQRLLDAEPTLDVIGRRDRRTAIEHETALEDDVE